MKLVWPFAEPLRRTSSSPNTSSPYTSSAPSSSFPRPISTSTPPFTPSSQRRSKTSSKNSSSDPSTSYSSYLSSSPPRATTASSSSDTSSSSGIIWRGVLLSPRTPTTPPEDSSRHESLAPSQPCNRPGKNELEVAKRAVSCFYDALGYAPSAELLEAEGLMAIKQYEEALMSLEAMDAPTCPRLLRRYHRLVDLCLHSRNHGVPNMDLDDDGEHTVTHLHEIREKLRRLRMNPERDEEVRSSGFPHTLPPVPSEAFIAAFEACQWRECSELVKNLAMFKFHTPAERQALLSISRLSHAPIGQFVFMQGECADSVFILIKGSVMLVQTNFEELGHDEPVVTDTLHDGQMLWSVDSAGNTRNCSAISQEETWLVEVNRHEMWGRSETASAMSSTPEHDEAAVNILRRVALFESVVRQEFVQMLHHCTYHDYSWGHVVVKEGQSLDAFYVLAQGQCEVRDPRADLVLNTLLPGHSFGSSVLADEKVESQVKVVVTSGMAQFFVFTKGAFLHVSGDTYTRVLKNAKDMFDKWGDEQLTPPERGAQLLASVKWRKLKKFIVAQHRHRKVPSLRG
eukprot:GEMP01028154.1.p1 GENE.GEMP01028154.1~~GEMP01028154.1.p1  ORF type:complete len:570 (+),score=122.78 GEMP01028154.1:19-1728(+)